MAVVEVSDLTVRIGGVDVVDRVSLTVALGEVVGLVGPNGAGKTTTIETVEGFRRPDGGAIRVFGVDPFQRRDAVTGRWGVMPQQPGLPTGLRVAEVVALHAALHPSTTPVEDLLALVGLADLARRPWRRLSGGEQQRLSLAVALVGRPELLLLDEPTAALDPLGRREVGQLLRARADAGAAVLVTTHLLDDVERTCDRIAVLVQGRIVAAGTVDELTGRSAVVTFAAPPGLDLPALGAAVGAAVSEEPPGRYRIDAPPGPELLARVTAWLATQAVTADGLGGGERLEDVYLRLTGASATPTREPA